MARIRSEGGGDEGGGERTEFENICLFVLGLAREKSRVRLGLQLQVNRLHTTLATRHSPRLLDELRADEGRTFVCLNLRRRSFVCLDAERTKVVPLCGRYPIPGLLLVALVPVS